MSLLNIAALIVMLLLALYGVDALRRPGRSARPLARDDGEPFHAFVRGRAPGRRSGAISTAAKAGRPGVRERECAGQQPLAPERPLERVRNLNDAYAHACRRSG